MKILIYYLYIFTLLVSLVYCNQHEWDLLIFTQHWPLTVCLQYEESLTLKPETTNHICTLPPNKNQWTIHGVWPTKLHTIGPSFCNNSMKFKPDELVSLKPDLLDKWPNIEGDKAVDSLWKHEWMKHGTCASVLSTMDTEYKYFETGLELLRKFNMTQILLSKNIYPSDLAHYKIEEIYNAVQQSIGKNPHLQCVTEKETKQPYLFEIRICFTKDLNLVDCDGIKSRRKRSLTTGEEILTNCPLNEAIKYPSQIQPNPPEFNVEPEEPIRWNILKECQDSSVGHFRLDFLLKLLRHIRFVQWLTL